MREKLLYSFSFYRINDSFDRPVEKYRGKRENSSIFSQPHSASLIYNYSSVYAIFSASESEAVPPPAKKGRYGTWEDQSISTCTPEEELELYLKTGKRVLDDDGTLLQWWQSKASLFPRLAILAKQILAIPATSANSERNFSRAGLIVTNKRSKISPENVDDLLVIHNYYLVRFLPTHAPL